MRNRVTAVDKAMQILKDACLLALEAHHCVWLQKSRKAWRQPGMNSSVFHRSACSRLYRPYRGTWFRSKWFDEMKNSGRVFMRGSCCFCNVKVTVTKPNQHLSSFLESGGHFYTEEVDRVIFLNVPLIWRSESLPNKQQVSAEFVVASCRKGKREQFSFLLRGRRLSYVTKRSRFDPLTKI
jgi:hypothetical protein